MIPQQPDLANVIKDLQDRLTSLEKQTRAVALNASVGTVGTYSDCEITELGFYDPTSGDAGPSTTVDVPPSGRLLVLGAVRVRPPNMEVATTGRILVSYELDGANVSDWLGAGLFMSGFIDTGGQTTLHVSSIQLRTGLTPGLTTVKMVYACDVDGYQCGVDQRVLVAVPL